MTQVGIVTKQGFTFSEEKHREVMGERKVGFVGKRKGGFNWDVK